MSDPHPLIGVSAAPKPSSEQLTQLLERLRRGEDAALEALIEVYWEPLVRYARRILESTDGAEDIVQETFLRLWQGRRGMAGAVNLQAFLYGTTRNRCLNERRRGRIRARYRVKRLIPMPGASPSPLETAEAGELEAAARAAVEGLPRRRREIFELARHDGLSYREIAEVLHISPQTVANQMSAALDQLRKRLSGYLENR